MPLKTNFYYSPNFNSKKRSSKKIRFIIFHYTGMKTESSALKKLTDEKSKVSSHYLIKKNGQIFTIVPDLYVAWHAGVSSWNNFNALNKNSIGIEISNPGHSFGYIKFSKAQILSLVKLSKFLIKKYDINIKNILGHSDIAPDRKNDPGEKFPWKYLSKKKIGIWHQLSQKKLVKNRKVKTDEIKKNLFIKNLIKIGYSKNSKYLNVNKTRYKRIITKAFQRRFRPELIDGKIDQECFVISQNLIEI